MVIPEVPEVGVAKDGKICRRTSDAGSLCIEDLKAPQGPEVTTQKGKTCRRTSDAGTQCIEDLG